MSSGGKYYELMWSRVRIETAGGEGWGCPFIW